jgi:hypothetical protein
MNAQNYSNIQAAIAGTSFIPVVGWGISLGLGIVDYVWGEQFYNYLDN